MSPKPIQLERGEKFDRLTVLRKLDIPGNIWRCKCKCGNKISRSAAGLKAGYYKSCGCLRRDTAIALSKKNIIHGAVKGNTHTHLYGIWAGIKHRTSNPKNPSYEDYGKRGIKIHPKWKNDFVAFRDYVIALPKCPSKINEWVGQGIKFKRTLHRINNDGNYEPGNLMWATGHTQQHNTRRTIWVKYKGKKISLARLCYKFGLDIRIFRRRHKRGWTVRQIVGEAKPPKGFYYSPDYGWLKIREAARIYKVDYIKIHNRIRLGWTPEQCLGLTKPPYGIYYDKDTEQWLNLRDTARKFGMNHEKLRHRITRAGWSVERALGLRKPPNAFIWHRVQGWLNIAEIAHLFNIQPDTLRYRIRQNWKLYRAFEIDPIKFNKLFDLSRS